MLSTVYSAVSSSILRAALPQEVTMIHEVYWLVEGAGRAVCCKRV